MDAPDTPLPRDALDRARAGDGEALGRFFDHYVARLFSFIRRFTGSTEEAEDLTQEVFLKVRRGIGRLDVTRDPAPWLFTIAVNACRDQRRTARWRAAQRSIPIVPGGDGDVPGVGDDPALAFARAEERRRLLDAIGRLPADQFMCVVLHDFEDVPHERIAAMAGIEHATARKRHSRALRSLHRMLAERNRP